MNTGKNKLESITLTRPVGPLAKIRLLTLLLLSVMLIQPLVSQADGLFDFQMTLAQKGNAEAEFKVGEMYETGFGVDQDMKQAESWITKAAEKGHETAGFKLLYWDLEKNGVNAGNKAGLESLQTKARDGNPQAQYYVGKMYSRGVGLKKNPDEAVNWLNKAAFVGVLEAEREMVVAREQKQEYQLEQQRAAEKKRAEQLKAQQEKEKQAQQAKLEEQRKLQEQKQLEAKARAEELAKQNKAAAEEARAKAEKQRLAAEKQQALAKQKAEELQREADKQALIKKREAEEQQRKAQFESDPCSGKSARFLSTCK